MTLEKAIKELQARINRSYHIQDRDKCEDMMLGIEALKYVQDIRHIINTPNPELLPGETKED